MHIKLWNGGSIRTKKITLTLSLYIVTTTANKTVYIRCQQNWNKHLYSFGEEGFPG